MKRSLTGLCLLLSIPSAVLAVTTQKFSLGPGETFDKGKVEGAAVHASGKVTRAISTTRTPVEGASVAFASAEGPDGAIYVATGNEGTIYRVPPADGKPDAKQVATPFAKIDAAVISALVWSGKTLYAGTLPGGRVVAIDDKGKARAFAKLEGAEHVWALVHDAKKNTFYAGTGPSGRIFAIDGAGKPTLLLDDDAEHVLALGLDSDGVLYAGTSNGARLLRLRGAKSEVLYDAEGQEITTLAVGAGEVAIASNDFPDPPAAMPDGARDATSAGRARRPKPGKGKVIRVGFDGSAREVFQSDTGHVSALAFEDKGAALQVGLGAEGHVYRVSEPGERTRWADADERQVVDIHLDGKHPHFITSDGAAVYAIGGEGAAGTWTSASLDAKSRARFGELRMRGRGKIGWSTRSGNSETPGKEWSEWSPALAQDGAIRSAEARFLQVRATLEGDAELYAFEAYYLPQNVAAVVRNVRVSETKSDPKASVANASFNLRWEVENPDQDRLRYRVWFRREGQQAALQITREDEVLDHTDIGWDTSAVPDGYYRVEVEASDELATPAPFVKRARAISAPVLVDHRAPDIGTLVFDGKQTLKARAHDEIGPISRAEIAIDGAPATPVSPLDGLLDERDEEFEVALPVLQTGAHLVTLRAHDAAENVSTKTIEVVTR